ncbi:MAG: hypothetical protein P4M15_03955 [Alphaproteobacteria bacterium]|nr:hypothetical protein [Alphaproteobacteria bacterium]
MSDSEITPTPGSAFPTSSATGMIAVGPSWQEQDAALRDLWLQNKTPQEISAVLNRSVAAIMTRAARLGLPRRSAPGRKPGSRRLPIDANGQQMPRAAAPRQTRIQDGEPVVQPSPRICLMCLRSFASQGRHNRICPSCKGSSEYAAAASTADIHLPV